VIIVTLKTIDKKLLCFIMVITITIAIGSIWVLSLVPPVSRDALVHHLAVPKIYLMKGAMVELPCMPFSYYPMNLDLLYGAALAMGSDIAPKFIHGAFGLLTAVLIYFFLKKRMTLIYALTGVILFLTVPIIIRLSISAYVDLGVTFFSFGALLSLLVWSESGHMNRWLAIAGGCTGLAMGTKYTGLISLVTLIPIVWYLRTRGPGFAVKKTFWLATRDTVLFCGLATLLFSPWMMRNIAWTGNPIYPLFAEQETVSSKCEIPRYTADHTRTGYNKFAYRQEVYGESNADLILLPIRYFYEGKDHDPRRFDGKLGMLLLLLPLLICLKKRVAGISLDEKVLSAFSILYFCLAFYFGPLRIRYIVPIIPCLVLLSMIGTKSAVNYLFSSLKPFRKGVVVTALVCSLAYWAMDTIYYFNDLYREVTPFEYLGGEVSKSAYISKFRPEYDAISYMNHHLTQNSQTLFIFVGGRGYYCDTPYIPDQNHNLFVFYDLIRKHSDPAAVLHWLKARNISHLLLNNRIVKERIGQDLSDAERKQFLAFIYHHTDVAFDKKGFSLYVLK
jgi:4-amino-4-deoxy-L-arabinose transferase-like glycosyltransferase